MATSINYNRAFWNMLRGKSEDKADLNEGFDSGFNGYVIPNGFSNDYTAALAKENLFRRFGTILKAPTKEGFIQTVTSTAEAEFIGEGVAYPESADSFSKLAFGSHKLASLTRLFVDFVSDMDFDLERYLRNEFARRFGRAEENAFFNGTGIEEPTGLLNTAQTGITAASLLDVTYDEIVGLFFSLKPEYRRDAVWLMNDETGVALRTLKDKNDNYLWRESDDTILGKPVVFSPYVPGAGSGSKPVAFGDLSFYWITERQPLTVKTLTERYIHEGQIGFASFERLDGRLIRPEAVKTLQMAE